MTNLPALREAMAKIGPADKTCPCSACRIHRSLPALLDELDAARAVLALLLQREDDMTDPFDGSAVDTAGMIPTAPDKLEEIKAIVAGVISPGLSLDRRTRTGPTSDTGKPLDADARESLQAHQGRHGDLVRA